VVEAVFCKARFGPEMDSSCRKTDSPRRPFIAR